MEKLPSVTIIRQTPPCNVGKTGAKPDDLQTVVSYTYTKAGKALSETRTDENAGWITEYVYDAAGRIESVKRSKTDKFGQWRCLRSKLAPIG